MPTVELRPVEDEQLHEFVIQIVDRYNDMDLDDRAETISELVASMEDGVIEADEDTFETLAVALDELEQTRAAWLRTKIARRAHIGVEHMGFTTALPIGAMATGMQPAE